MIPTPDLSHLKAADYENVYEPAEDTFILLDALENDLNELRALGAAVCLEIGSGSGCVSTFMGTLLGPSTSLFLCTDINPHAARATSLTGQQNRVVVHPVLTSLTASLLPRLRRAVDVLLFNPPYVPTDTGEAVDGQGGIAGAWAGGLTGMDLTEPVLEQLDELMSERGRFYLVAVKENDPVGIVRRMGEKGFKGEIVLKRRTGRELLHVLRFTR